MPATPKGIFVPPGNVEALVTAIQSLGQDPESCRRMGRSAHEYVVKYFNRDRQAAQFLNLLRQMTGQAGCTGLVNAL